MPVPFLKVCGAVSERANGLELGADDGRVKPYAFVELLARVRALTGGGRITPNATADARRTAVLSDRDSDRDGLAEHLARLAERFRRADPARTRGIDGVGSGLAIVRSIMTLHGGTFWAEPRLGHGDHRIARIPSARDDDPSISRRPASGDRW